MHGSGSKTAVLFWQNTMYSNADVVLTPRPLHMDDRMIMWCYSKPPGFYEKLIEKIGKFDLTWYWGPLVSKKSSEWIEKATEFVLENENLVYYLHIFPIWIILSKKMEHRIKI